MRYRNLGRTGLLGCTATAHRGGTTVRGDDLEALADTFAAAAP
jgi:hypothetical protein